MSRLLLDTLVATFWFDDALQASLEHSGFTRLTRSQSFVIANIALGVHRAGNISRNLGVSRQATSLMLNELEARGMICFEPDPTDGRARITRLSKPFLKQGEAALAILKEVEVILEERIGAERVAGLRDAFGPDWGEPPVVKYDAPQSRKRKAAT